MENWSIELAKAYHHFSAAHFLIFPDGTAERLHGHNYRVFVDIQATLGEHGLVLDFKKVKPIVTRIIEELDEHWLVPGEHPEFHIDQQGDATVMVYRDRTYHCPTDDIYILPLNNISAENLSTWIGREIMSRLTEKFSDVQIVSFSCGVEETIGQRGVYRYTMDEA